MATTCPQCGSPLGVGAAFCSACGTRVTPASPLPPPGAVVGHEQGSGELPMRPRREPSATSRMFAGGWGLPLSIAAPGLGLLILAGLAVSWGLLRGDSSRGLLFRGAAALVGAAFGGDVDVTRRWARTGGVLDRIVVEQVDSVSLHTIPLTLTLIVAATISLGFWLRTRNLPDVDLLPVAVKTSLCLAGGVILVTSAGRIGSGRADDSAASERLGESLRIDVHASTVGSAAGALVLGLLVLGVTLLVTRPSLLPARLSPWRSALAAPSWVMLVLAVSVTGLAALALLVGVLVRGDGTTLAESVGAAAVLPNIAAGVMAVALGPGVEVRRVVVDVRGSRDSDDLAVGTLYLPDLGDASATAWLMPVGLLLAILLAGLLLATRYDSPAQARRGGLIAGGLTWVMVTVWCAVATIDRNNITNAALSPRPAALTVGVWMGLLVAGSVALATVLLPRLPRPALRMLAFVARRPAAHASTAATAVPAPPFQPGVPPTHPMQAQPSMPSMPSMPSINGPDDPTV